MGQALDILAQESGGRNEREFLSAAQTLFEGGRHACRCDLALVGVVWMNWASCVLYLACCQFLGVFGYVFVNMHADVDVDFDAFVYVAASL